MVPRWASWNREAQVIIYYSDFCLLRILSTRNTFLISERINHVTPLAQRLQVSFMRTCKYIRMHASFTLFSYSQTIPMTRAAPCNDDDRALRWAKKDSNTKRSCFSHAYRPCAVPLDTFPQHACREAIHVHRAFSFHFLLQ